MYHHFIFCKLSDNPRFDYLGLKKTITDVSLHDDLLYYIFDSLQWVESFNPAKNMQSQTGLNFTGPTVIKETGARRLNKVLVAWILLLQQSPEKLKLTGAFAQSDCEPSSTGFYEKLEFDRDEVIGLFKNLASLCMQAANSRGEAYIMHKGL